MWPIILFCWLRGSSSPPDHPWEMMTISDDLYKISLPKIEMLVKIDILLQKNVFGVTCIHRKYCFAKNEVYLYTYNKIIYVGNKLIFTQNQDFIWRTTDIWWPIKLTNMVRCHFSDVSRWLSVVWWCAVTRYFPLPLCFFPLPFTVINSVHWKENVSLICRSLICVT